MSFSSSSSSTTTTTTTTNTITSSFSLSSLAEAAAAAAHHRDQISIPSLTSNGSRNRTRYTSLSPPPASALKPCHHHPYKMHHSMSHPGISSALMTMRSPPTASHGKDHTNYCSPPTSPLHHYNDHKNHLHDPLQERRQRNKAASAKYRQKKNMQQHEMRSMICQISDRNAMLERQLQEVRQENQQLQATADKLRGKLMASKLLDQWMQKQSRQVKLNQVDIDTVVDSDNDSEMSVYDL
ncbi:uncharacterized protein ATC70_000131 [Mucor velutinosus]|uniref:BZIP domain-containing protein n=1 Tax=Mucor velutinosus TaxID=708070 RepID=A0AAN7D973_9FUNG|nr:hypothetical protein ATC70_000131 [Mucor velutinosus]